MLSASVAALTISTGSQAPPSGFERVGLQVGADRHAEHRLGGQERQRRELQLRLSGASSAAVEPDQQRGEQRRRTGIPTALERERRRRREGAEDEPRRRRPHRAQTLAFAPMLVSEAVGRTVHALGGDVVFGLMGSGNLAVTNAIVAAGGRFFSVPPRDRARCAWPTATRG